MEISFTCQSRYPVGKKFIISSVEELLKQKGCPDNCAVDIFICGTRKMRELSRRYLRDAVDHEVLSFTFDEVKKEFVDFPDGLRYLGNVVVCFPIARQIAMEENKLIDEVIADLACHGTLHLLGEHHEDYE